MSEESEQFDKDLRETINEIKEVRLK